MNTDDIKKKISHFAKDQLPFLVKLYDVVVEKLPKKNQDQVIDGENLSDPDDTSEFDIDGGLELDGIQIIENDNTPRDIPESHQSSGDDDLDEDGEKSEKEKKRSKIIKIIAIIAILFVVIDEFVLTKDVDDENSNLDEVSEGLDSSGDEIKKKRPQNIKLDDIDQMTEEGTKEVEMELEKKKQAQMKLQEDRDSNNDFTIEDLSQGQSEDSDLDNSNDELMDLENQLDSDKRDDESPEDSTDIDDNADGLESTEFDKSGYEKLDTPQRELTDEEILFKEEDYEDITPVELEKEIEEKKTQQEVIESPQDQEIEGVSINILRELEEKLKQKELSRDQDLIGKKKDLSLQGRKVPVVDYFAEGRGLVYNCQAGHWACVEEINYLQCREGFQLNNLRNAESTCLPFSVYKTIKDCKRAQYESMGSDEEKKCRQ